MTIIALALDPNTRQTGIAFIAEDGSIHSTTRLNADGWLDMMTAIWQLLEQYDPQYVGCEGTYYGANPETRRQLEQLVAAARVWCQVHQRPFYEGSVYEIDSTTGIRGSYRKGKRKEANAAFVRTHLGLTSPELTQDEIDACCVAWWAESVHRRAMLLRDAERDDDE